MALSKKKKKVSFNNESSITRPEISIHLTAKPPVLTPILKKSERRGAPRYKAEFETVIFCEGVSFRTKAQNISETGLLLIESIPTEFVGQVLDIVMIHQVGRTREFFLVKGRGVEDRLRSPRLHFVMLSKAQKKKLDDLLETLEIIS